MRRRVACDDEILTARCRGGAGSAARPSRTLRCRRRCHLCVAPVVHAPADRSGPSPSLSTSRQRPSRSHTRTLLMHQHSSQHVAPHSLSTYSLQPLCSPTTSFFVTNREFQIRFLFRDEEYFLNKWYHILFYYI